METNPLFDLFTKELVDLQVNTFKNGKNGTLQLAEDYIQGLDNCTSKRSESAILEMYYKGEIFGRIQGQSPSTNDKSAIRMANNKIKTENILKEKAIRTTESKVFDQTEYSEAKKFINLSSESMVIKPHNLNGGRGITLKVTNDNFDFAWRQATDAYTKKKKQFKVMIQPFISGFETRMLVIENKFNSAILRVPSNVVGDGQSTISKLIQSKNELRKQNPYLKRHIILIDDVVEFNLNQQGLEIESIPHENQVIFLQNSSNITQGGDNYEVSHLVGKGMIKVAENAISAIQGFRTGGVDLLVESFDNINPLVLELNPGANLRMHHYPWKGEPKTPVYDLIDKMLDDYKKM